MRGRQDQKSCHSRMVLRAVDMLSSVHNGTLLTENEEAFINILKIEYDNTSKELDTEIAAMMKKNFQELKVRLQSALEENERGAVQRIFSSINGNNLPRENIVAMHSDQPDTVRLEASSEADEWAKVNKGWALYSPARAKSGR